MDANDDFHCKPNNCDCFYIHIIFKQKYPQPAIVNGTSFVEFHGRLQILNTKTISS